MRILDKTTGEILGKVITNQSLTLEAACELAGIEYDPETMATTPYDSDPDHGQALYDSKTSGETFVGERHDGGRYLCSPPLSQDEVADIACAFHRGETVNIDGEFEDALPESWARR